jgi:hypothetical protein
MLRIGAAPAPLAAAPELLLLLLVEELELEAVVTVILAVMYGWI